MWPIQLAFLLFTVRRIFISFPALCKISAFFTRSVQLIFSILLQHHISKLSRYFWSSFRSVQVPSPHTAKLQMQNFSSFLRKFKSNCLVGKNLLLVECCCCHGNPVFNFSSSSCTICYHAIQIVEILHIVRLFFSYHNLYLHHIL